MNFKPESLERLQKLESKYKTIGQDLDSYLDGLLYGNVTAYWDYLNLDAFLNLQNPKTDFPDELIFIGYHQITEMYFKLILHEMNQVAHNGRNVDLVSGEDYGWNEKMEVSFFTERLQRMNKYFEALTKSFDIMVLGMEKEQFLRFRMALLPASGFQSAQYRMIEICATDFINIVSQDKRELYDGASTVDQMFEHIYWKRGATEVASGEKTLTLKNFEKKYADKLIALAHDYRNKNLWVKYLELSKEEKADSHLLAALKQFDLNVNVNWPLVHYKSAVQYLQKSTEDIAATGGTNWQKYLPPRFQRRIFYPELWSDSQMEQWGKVGHVEVGVEN